MRRDTFIALLTAVGCACSRSEDDRWRVEERLPSLETGLVLYQPDEEPITLSSRPGLFEEVQKKMRLSFEVRMRAKDLPATLTSVTDVLNISERVVEVGPSWTRLNLTVESADVTMDPSVEQVEEERSAGFNDASLRIRVDSKEVLLEPSEDGSRQLSDQEREIFEAWRRLVPLVPDNPVAVGERWPFSAEFYRALPGGGLEHTSLKGNYRFRGMADLEGSDVAVIDLDYRVSIAGASTHKGQYGSVTGSGIGRALFLLDRETGQVVQSQVVETARSKIELEKGGGKYGAEQSYRLTFELEAGA